MKLSWILLYGFNQFLWNFDDSVEEKFRFSDVDLWFRICMSHTLKSVMTYNIFYLNVIMFYSNELK